MAQSKVRARGMSDLTRRVKSNEFAGGITRRDRNACRSQNESDAAAGRPWWGCPRYWVVRRPRSYELDDCPVGVLRSAPFSRLCPLVGLAASVAA